MTRRRDTLLRLIAALALLAVMPMAGVGSPPAAGEPGDSSFLNIRIDRVNPDVVTTTSDAVVTVTGTVTNIGDRPVRDIVVRLEHAGPVTSSEELQSSLDGPREQYQPVGKFISVARQLERGQSAPFTLSYPVRADARPSLDIGKPGVYPLLVNANGTPDYGAPARLDDARFLLPVVGVPADPAGDSSAAMGGVVPPDTSRPVQMTMLWPLADRPRLAPGAPGGASPVRLIDDDLAGSLAAGGRLDTLLSAAEFATKPEVDEKGRVATALCLAVDPDLLVTVNAMAAGYVVMDDPDDRNSATRPGTGQAAAGAWLDRLRALASRICVAPTPYAQADLDALQRVGDPGLSAIATSRAADVVDQILGVASNRGATLLGDGALTRRAADLLSAQGPTVAISAASPGAREGDTGAPETADLTPYRVSPQVVSAPFDPTVGAAMAGAGQSPTWPSYLNQSSPAPHAKDSNVARRQDAVSSMLWLALTPGVQPRAQIVMPPLYWDLQPPDAQAILTALATAVNAGLAVPRPLTGVITDAEVRAVPMTRPLAEPDPDIEFDETVVEDIRREVGPLWGLTAAMTADPRTGLTGAQYTAPLREDMLRALSQSVPPRARDDQAIGRLDAIGTTIDDMFGAVTIVNPGGSYTLATERSPLPLALRNDLPVPIKVRLQVDAPPGMTVTDIGVQELPPGYLPVRVPVEVHFTQRVAVDVTLRTPDGLPLGEPVRLSVHSNAYGKVLFAITISAGAVLVLLAGRRLWHRFRGQPDRADLDAPGRA